MTAQPTMRIASSTCSKHPALSLTFNTVTTRAVGAPVTSAEALAGKPFPSGTVTNASSASDSTNLPNSIWVNHTKSTAPTLAATPAVNPKVVPLHSKPPETF